MNEESRIEIEEVDAVAVPARARVAPEIAAPEISAPEISAPEISAPEISAPARTTPEFERKRDYLSGFLAATPEPAASNNETLVEAVVEALKSIYDPEIPVDIYELGLIYDVAVSEDGDALVSMTLTTPNCPVAESMPGEVELRVLSVPGIRDAEVKLVWDPPWDPSKMSDEARLELGML
jgi:FeS assembly SUF system protein